MDRRINPFSESYVTETIPVAQFVRIFSPYVVEMADELFLPGNVVLKGVQGCGKSMLLTLLKPELRVAYARAGEKFPLQGRYAMFIAAGINLTRSRAIDVGQRNISSGHDAAFLSLFFADFLNYWIVGDLLRSIEVYGRELDGRIARDLGLKTAPADLDRFAMVVAESHSWLGFFNNCRTFGQLQAKIADRIQTYLKFFNFVIEVLPPELCETRTAIAEPVSETSEALNRAGILPDDIHIFVRIDQYEELAKIEAQFKQGPVYRSIVHKALALRNPHVSYRIGTRSYGFKEENLEVFGTTAKLERDRNYKVIDLDQLLRRQENRKTWLFPKFAEDVFRKRMRLAGYDVNEGQSCLESVFGKGSPPEERALRYCAKSSERVVRLDPTWPEAWRTFLVGLAATNPLSARLGEAWARQAKKGRVVDRIPPGPPYPWDGKGAKAYWHKERVQAALMQIASRCSQRMIWGGRNDVIQLSGGNVLVFVGICQQIWSVWLRTVRDANRQDPSLPKIDENIQTLGIHEASTHWFEKLCEETDGNKRQRFISYVGTLLQRELLNDSALSYPGRNGFSLSLDDLMSDHRVRDFLDDAVDYGALFDAEHTTKEKNRKPRRKWYLNPSLSPHFRLPHVHTKEPYYAALEQVRNWIVASVDRGVEEPQEERLRANSRGRSHQGSLFGPRESIAKH